MRTGRWRRKKNREVCWQEVMKKKKGGEKNSLAVVEAGGEKKKKEKKNTTMKLYALRKDEHREERKKLSKKKKRTSAFRAGVSFQSVTPKKKSISIRVSARGICKPKKERKTSRCDCPWRLSQQKKKKASRSLRENVRIEKEGSRATSISARSAGSPTGKKKRRKAAEAV